MSVIQLVDRFISSKKTQYILCLLLLISLFIAGYIHSTKGINFTDESYYIATPYHLSHGGIIFQDEFINANHQFDIILTPLFILFPKITLLQYRMFGISLFLLSLTVLFMFLARRAPALLVGLACAIAFSFNVFTGISSPSYNVLASSFSLVALVALMESFYLKDKKKQVALAVVGGTFLSLTVISYLTFALLIGVPILILILSVIFRKEIGHYFLPSLVCTLTVFIIFAGIFVYLVYSNLLMSYIENLQNINSQAELLRQGISNKLFVLFQYLVILTIPAILILIGTCTLFYLSKITSIKKVENQVYLWLTGVAVFFACYWIAVSLQPLYLILTVLILTYSLISLVLLWKNRTEDNRIYILIIGWGLFQAFIYMIFSSIGINAFIRGSMALVAVFPIIFYNHSKKEPAVRALLYLSLVTILSTFLLNGINYYLDTICCEEKPYNLTMQFSTPKLAGIYSTPEKVKPLEELLDYLKDKVKPGDNFLAYNDLPLLYYLTETKPIYNSVWSIDNYWHYDLKRKLTDKMIQSKKTSQYAVRMDTDPGLSWQMPLNPNPNDYRMPIDDYVKSRYYLEKIIFPYEVWKLGSKPPYSLIDNQKPVYVESFSNWNNSPTKDAESLKPLSIVIQGGGYNIDLTEKDSEKIARITLVNPVQGAVNSVVLSYSNGMNDFEIPVKKGRQLIFRLNARVSNRKDHNPAYPAMIFIQTNNNDKDFSAVGIYKTTWDDYFVAKKIEEDNVTVRIGLQWMPEGQNHWIEIKDLRIYNSPL